MWKLIYVILICCIFILGVIKVIHMIKNKKQNSTYSIVLFSISLIIFTGLLLLAYFQLLNTSPYLFGNANPDNSDPFTYPIVKGRLKFDVQKINQVKSFQKRSNTGLGKDIDVYLSELKEAEYDKWDNQSHVIIQGNNIILLEHIPSGLSNHVGNIIFIPNQELVHEADEKLLLQPGYVDRVLCKSTYAYEIFEKFRDNHRCTWQLEIFAFPPILTTQFFTQPKDRRIYFHPAGKSWMKHTSKVLEAWLKNPHWPMLIFTCKNACASKHREALLKIQDVPNITAHDFLSSSDMKSLQMHAGVVIMPSACEGFGHSIYETMENGNLLISSDIPPINENLVDGVNSLLISPSSVEILGDPTGKFKWLYDRSAYVGQAGSACFDISIEGIEKAVERSLKLSDEEYDKIRLNAVKKVYQLVVNGKESTKAALQRSGFVLNKKEDLTTEIDITPDHILSKNSRVLYYLGALGQMSNAQIKNYFSKNSSAARFITEPEKTHVRLWEELIKLLRKNNFREDIPIFTVLGDLGPKRIQRRMRNL